MIHARFSLLTILATTITATPLLAHDLWLVPPPTATAGQLATIRANVGMDFPVSESAPNVDAFTKRRVVLPGGKETIVETAGVDGASGLLKFMPNGPGIFVFGVETSPKVLEMTADDFNHYLVADGLPHVFIERYQNGTLKAAAKERYSKSPKCLLQVGDGPGDPCRAMGLPLEIVPLKNPFQTTVGTALPVRVLFQGRPLAEANLGWSHPDDGPRSRGTVRTNDKGEALIPIAKPGLMTIRLTHMTYPRVAEYEWESFWTTLTWHMPNAAR